MSGHLFGTFSAAELADRVRDGELSAVAVLEDALARVEERNPALNAFIHVDEELARASAADIDRQVRDGSAGPFAGVPIGVKDAEDCAGMPTAFGCDLLRGRPPAAVDAISVARLRAAGCVPIGKTAMPEFGTDTATLSPGWGVTRNPWNPALTPGGSSGGSASAVAAGMVPLATGTDSGGSVRGPAAYCGLVGMKPTAGLVPAPGSGASGMLSHGALVTTVRDAARHLDMVAGPDARDPRSLPRSGMSFEQELGRDVPSGLRIGWSRDLGFAVIDDEAADLSYGVARELAARCHTRLTAVGIDWPNPEDIWWETAILDTWMLMEVGMWPAGRDRFAPTTQDFLSSTQALTPAKLAAQLRRRHQLETAIADTLDQVDILLTPTMASTAFPAEESVPTIVNGIEMPDGAEPFTAFANVAGLPAISVPAGHARDGMPVGLQIVGHRFADGLVLRVAREAELACPWQRLAPWPARSRG